MPAAPPRTRATTRPPPIDALLELLGRRWALRLLWELRAGALPFGELQRRCAPISPSVLSQRLRELVEAGILEPDAEGRYAPSRLARELDPPLRLLEAWSLRWARRRRPAQPPARVGRPVQ